MTQQLRVSRLRLEARDARAVRDGRALLEAAFRRIPAPNEGSPGRIHIRRLDVGSISRFDTEQTLSTRLGDMLHTLARSAVPFAAPGARDAVAVWVAHEIDPYVEVVRRACEPAPRLLDEWFWPHLVPGLQRGASSAAASSLALRRIASCEQPLRVLTELLLLLIQSGTAERFLRQLDAADDAVLLAICGLRGAPLGEGSADPSGTDPAPSAESRLNLDTTGQREAHPGVLELAERLLPAWGAEQGRSLWLCHVALVAAAPSAECAPATSWRARALARALAADRKTAGRKSAREWAGPSQRGRAMATEPVSCEALAAARSPTGSHSSPPGGHPARRDARPDGALPANIRDLVRADGLDPNRVSLEGQPAAAWRGEAQSAFAGLFLLLNVLSRLQIAAFLEAHPHFRAWELGSRVLRRIAEQLQLPEGDALWAALELRGVAPHETSFVAPRDWWSGLGLEGPAMACSLDSRVVVTKGGLALASFDAARAPQLPEPPSCSGPSVDASLGYEGELAMLLDSWALAVPRWLRCYAGIDTRFVVEREGYLQLSKTHLDVSFEMDRADIELRRAALDIDPGYLPWFGKTSRYHYVRGVVFPSAP
jgi:hypothetical protein